MATVVSSFVLAVCQPVLAAEESSKSPSVTMPASPLNAGTLLETLLGLVLVLGCIVLVAWLLKRTSGFSSSANGELKIIAGIALGAREKAILLQVGEQQILVGVTPQQIRTLHVLPEAVSQNTSSKENAFADRLKQVLKQREPS